MVAVGKSMESSLVTVCMLLQLYLGDMKGKFKGGASQCGMHWPIPSRLPGSKHLR